MRVWQCAIILVFTAAASAAMSQQLTSDQLQQIVVLCQTVKDARGQKTGSELQAEVEAKAAGLLGSVFNVGGGTKGTISREKFEGLTQQATAELLKGDRDCRKEIAMKLFEAMRNNPQATSAPQAPAVKSEAAPQVQSTPQVQSPPKKPFPELHSPFRLDH
jgi:hypothetical protein